MRTLIRNKRKVYVCYRIDDESKVMKYNEPIPFFINLMPLSDESEIAVYGEHYTEILKGVLMLYELGEIKEFDRVFVEVDPPVQHDILCDSADFEIDSVSHTLTSATIIMRKRL